MRVRPRLACAAMVLMFAGAAGCSGDVIGAPDSASSPASADSASSSAPRDTGTASPGDTASPSSSASAPPATSATSPSASQSNVEPVTIAFGGDLHFSGSLASRLSGPLPAVGPLGRRLAQADLAIVNLETAVTTRGTPEPKQYVFRAPPEVFGRLKDFGIDVVTMANNHGLDYGPPSVPDALNAARKAGLPVIGLGRNADAAYRPWIANVKGQRIAFLAATAVVDAALVDSWSATDTQAGVATALDYDNAALVAAVEAVRPHADTVVVDMHYGSDLQQCPTDIQRAVARDVVRAGADVVVGQHAHVLLGAGYLGSAYVDYGMGNFQFYSAAGATAETGVLTVTVQGRRVTSPRWHPGVLSGGVPVPLTGASAADAVERWKGLRACAGLTERAVAPRD